MPDETDETNPFAELLDGQWRVGSWRGFEMLTCAICKWDTLEGLTTAQAYKAHCSRCAPPAPYLPSGILVADSFGREVGADEEKGQG